MAEFKLGRIRFVWKGAWYTGTIYSVDDVQDTVVEHISVLLTHG